MTPLLPIFVEAVEKFWQSHHLIGDASFPYVDDGTGIPYKFSGTHAECKRFIAERAAQKGFAALRDAVENPNRSTVGWLFDQLAGGHDDR